MGGEPHGGRVGPERVRRVPGIVWVLMLLYGLTASGRVGNVDASVTLEMTRALLRGSVELPADCGFCAKGKDGIRTSQYGLGHSLYLMPYVVAGRAVARGVPRMPQEMWEEFFVSFANVPLVGLLLAYLAWSWRRAGASEFRVGVGLGLFGLGTMLWPYSKAPFSDTLMALATFAAWFHWTAPEGRFRGVITGLWLGMAMLSRRQSDAVVPLLVAMAGLDAFRTGRWGSLGGLMGGMLPAALARLAYNAARFGSPWIEKHPGIRGIEMVTRSKGDFQVWETLGGAASGIVPYNLIAVLVAAAGIVGLWRYSRRDAVVVGVMVTGGVGFLIVLPFSSGVSFGSRYAVYLVAFLGLAWPWVPWPRAWWSRALWAPPLLASLWLMMGGVVLDPVPVGIRCRMTDPPFNQWKAMNGEWARVLSPVHRPDLPALEARAEWGHDAFERPDFWWCHLLARVRGRNGVTEVPGGPPRP